MNIQPFIEKIQTDTDVRESLGGLRRVLKEEGAREEFRRLTAGDYGFLYRCLKNEDAKVRKNVAGVLELLSEQESLEPLYEAYENEKTLFVNSSYLKAMLCLDCRKYLPDFTDRLQMLETMEIPEEEKKHRREEIAALRTILSLFQGIARHKFREDGEPLDVLLTVQKGYEPQLCACFAKGRAKVAPIGVMARIRHVARLQEIRFWNELLVPVKLNGKTGTSPEEAARSLLDSDLLPFLREHHSGEDKYYFRMDIIGRMEKSEKTDFVKKAAVLLEEHSGHCLVNSPADYEVEIRLYRTKEGNFWPFLHLGTIADDRFAYRRSVLPTSMKPAQAALIVHLAKPYLRPQAQVLDPFCGTGTLLIERNLAVAAKTMYGVDTFGKAVDAARKNTQAAGARANYVNRDFFRFTCDTLFDEIITEFPDNFDGDREKSEEFYRSFFQKCSSLLAESGRLILVSREEGRIKKQMRLTKKYHLLQEYTIREKSGLKLFIMEAAEHGRVSVCQR